MNLFNKMEGQFKDGQKEAVDEFKDLSSKTIAEFDNSTEKLNKEKVNCGVINLTSVQLSEDIEDVGLYGSIMGSRKALVDLLAQAMLKDDAFKSLIVSALNNVEGQRESMIDESGDDNVDVRALALGPNGETIDFDSHDIPQNVKDALKKMLKKGVILKKGTDESSGSKSGTRRKLSDDDISNFNDDISELEDDDY